MNESSVSGSRRAGAAGGTLLSLLASLHCGDLVKTAVLAAVGAIVSFCVSYLLKRLVKHLRR